MNGERLKEQPGSKETGVKGGATPEAVAGAQTRTFPPIAGEGAKAEILKDPAAIQALEERRETLNNAIYETRMKGIENGGAAGIICAVAGIAIMFWEMAGITATGLEAVGATEPTLIPAIVGMTACIIIFIGSAIRSELKTAGMRKERAEVEAQLAPSRVETHIRNVRKELDYLEEWLAKLPPKKNG